MLVKIKPKDELHNYLRRATTKLSDANSNVGYFDGITDVEVLAEKLLEASDEIQNALNRVGVLMDAEQK